MHCSDAALNTVRLQIAGINQDHHLVVRSRRASQCLTI
jgi:hypothetical protein